MTTKIIVTRGEKIIKEASIDNASTQIMGKVELIDSRPGNDTSVTWPRDLNTTIIQSKNINIGTSENNFIVIIGETGRIKLYFPDDEYNIDILRRKK